MPFVPFVDTVKAVIENRLGTILWSYTLHFVKDGFTFQDMIDLAEDLFAWWRDEILPQQCNAVYLTKVSVYDLTSEEAPVYVYAPGEEQGTDADPVMALNVALCNTFRTSNRGRSARGRLYLAGLPETSAGANNWTDAPMLEALQDAFELLIDPGVSAGWTLVIASRMTDKQWREEGITEAVQTTEIRNTRFSTQRRRINKF
jgi:hypothetical protein